MRCHSAFSILTTRVAWLPPVFAAVLLGFQHTFWEDATAASIEMFDLLLFCILSALPAGDSESRKTTHGWFGLRWFTVPQ